MLRMIISFALALISALPAVSEQEKLSKPPVCITRNQVFSAIREELRHSPLEMLEFDEDHIDVPKVRCTSRSPHLQATSASYDSKSRALECRLRCAGGGCLPFYARVITTQPTSPLRSQSLRISRRDRLIRQPVSPTLKAGDLATLSIVTPVIRISLPVRCLQSGAIGETVRVRDPQANKVFLARIESKTRLALVGGLQ